jgi:hypothetical protein
MKGNLENFISMKKKGEEEQEDSEDIKEESTDSEEKPEENMKGHMPFGEYMKQRKEMKGRSGLAIFIQTIGG